MVAAMKWLLVALCVVCVSCFPEEELQQDVKLSKPNKAARPIPRWRWRLPPSYRRYRPHNVATNNVETSRAISEPENVVQSEEGVASLNAEGEGAQMIERRVVPKKIVFKTRRNGKTVVRVRIGKRDLRDVEELSAYEDPEEVEDITDPDAEQFVSEAVENAVADQEVEQSVQDATPTNLRYLLLEKVVKAERYELPLLNINKWFKNKHDGVVVTLANGRRLLILKGYEFFQDESTVVLDAGVMTDSWTLLESKDPVENSTLGDYVNGNEESFNSLHAAEKMMVLD